ncbi:hypothetical protein B296_00036237 [Ensete ventricosum]|uniref:Uncharacterized protein n=1 Tax=Ensete ventricosum TaxID=4639 RepID=A0A426YXP2_ENSVE|nr:hypothetical protein B296_00036237 [Ensete ventricosum]
MLVHCLPRPLESKLKPSRLLVRLDGLPCFLKSDLFSSARASSTFSALDRAFATSRDNFYRWSSIDRNLLRDSFSNHWDSSRHCLNFLSFHFIRTTSASNSITRCSKKDIHTQIKDLVAFSINTSNVKSYNYFAIPGHKARFNHTRLSIVNSTSVAREVHPAPPRVEVVSTDGRQSVGEDVRPKKHEASPSSP